MERQTKSINENQSGEEETETNCWAQEQIKRRTCLPCTIARLIASQLPLVHQLKTSDITEHSLGDRVSGEWSHKKL
jgi:hypothetical protein